MRSVFRIFGVVFCLAIASTLTFAATPQVKKQAGRDYVRLTFEWPEPTLFTAKTSGKNIILTFDRKTNPNVGAVLKQLSPYIVKVEKKADGKTVILTMDKPRRIRTFIGDNIGGIDLLDVNETKQVTVRQAAPEKKTAAAPKTEKPKAEKKAEVKPQKSTKTAKAEIKEVEVDYESLLPSAGEEVTPEAKATTSPAAPASAQTEPAPASGEMPATTIPAVTPEASPTVTAPISAAQNTSAEAATTETPKEASPSAVESVASEPVPTPPAPPSTPEPIPQRAATPSAQISATEAEPEEKIRHDSGASLVPLAVDNNEEAPHETTISKPVHEPEPIIGAPPANTAVEASQDGGAAAPIASNKITVSADAEGATLRFPLKERSALAAFTRMNTLWVVFDRKVDFDLSDFNKLPQTIIGKATLLPHDKATILRIPINDNIFPNVRQQEGQLDVAMILSMKKTPIEKPLQVSVSTEPPAPAHVFVPALESGETIEVVDPTIGDTLSITPFYAREEGIENTRNFVDFTLLATTQGLAIAKKADATEVIAMRNGLRIMLPKGANVSPEAASNQAAKEAVVLPAAGTLFSDEEWRLDPRRSLKTTMRDLFQETVYGPNEGAKNLARLRLAQLYLRDGFAVEAIGMLDGINRTSPSYYRSAKLSAMRGAANFLLYRFNDASRDFGTAELNNNIEAKYWRDMLADLLGSPDKTYDFLAMNKNYISKYPALFRQRLAIVAADRAIAAKEYNAALKIFDTLTKDQIIGPIQPYVDYLTAKISAENGQQAEAMDVWKRLAVDSSNKFVQARATFSVILGELDNNSITRDQAMDRLERLRLSWHGDGLELQIVQLLGDLYEDKKDYVNAMRVWQIGVTGFKNTGPAIEMTGKMEDTFVKLFNEGIADSMTPLEALALYYEYRNYTPTGPVGIQMIEKLADRLVGVDLLTTAAQLLEQQIRSQIEKTERSRIGAKLANIYLMNNQPKRALKALQESVYGDNPILLRVQRNQLTAQAMMQLGYPEEALTVLGQDESVGAEKLRAMIYWSKKDWPAITDSIEGIFRKRIDPSSPLTDEEAEYLLRLALSYVFQSDAEQLQYMRDYFSPLIKHSPYKDAFNFITTPEIKLNTRNFDDLLQALSNTRGFINTYNARVVAEAAGKPPETQQP